MKADEEKISVVSPAERTVRPLTRRYTRETEVERQIEELLASVERDRWTRMSLLDGSDDRPRIESLVYMTREYAATGEMDAAWKLIGVLIRRIDWNMRKYLARLYGLTGQEKDEIVDELSVAFYTEWLSREPAYEFWEVRFWVCLKRKLIELVQRRRRRMEHETTFADESDGEGEMGDLIEDPRAKSPELSAMVKSAMDYLKDPMKTAFYLYHHEDWQEKEIAQRLGVTDRSIRNYLRRAEASLAEWRAELE